MIYYNGREIGELHFGPIEIIKVYYKRSNRPIEKIWPEEGSSPIDTILSCYYNGYWIDEYPWTDDTPWKD